MRCALPEIRNLGFGVALLLVVNAAVVLSFPEARRGLQQQFDEWRRDPSATGFQRRTFQDHAGAHAYTLFVPHQRPVRQSMPAIVFLNGTGENGDDGVAPLLNGLAEQIRRTEGTFPFLTIFPQCHEAEANWSAGGPALHRTLHLLDELETEYNIDPDRIYLTGLSSGGTGAWNLAAAAPERFAALFPVSASGASDFAVQTVAAAGVPVLTFCHPHDDAGLVRAHREIHERLIALGCDSGMVEVPGRGRTGSDHNAWDFAFRNSALYSWLLRQSRTLNLRKRKLTPLPLLTATSESDVAVPLASTTASNFECQVEFMPKGDTAIEVVAGVEGASGVLSPAWWFNVVRPEKGGGGWRSVGDQRVEPVSLSATLSLQADRWNDLRIVSRAGRLKVFLNHWLLLETEAPNAEWKLFVRGVSAELDGGIRLQHLRGVNVAAVSEDNQEFPSDAALVPPVVSTTHELSHILSGWRKRSADAHGQQIGWRANRTGDNQWSVVQAVVSPVSDTANFQMMLGDQETQLQHVWNGQGQAQFSDRFFGNGLSRSEHRQWMMRFRDGQADSVLAQRCAVSFTAKQRTETVADVGGRNRGHQLVAVSGQMRPGVDPPAELFQRIPQLVNQPLAAHTLGLDEDQLSVVPQLAWANRLLCHVVQAEWSSGGISRFYVSPQHDFAIVRFEHVEPAGGTDVVTIEFEHAAPAAELRGWKMASTRGEDHVTKSVFPGVDSVVWHAEAAVSAADLSACHGSDRQETIVYEQPLNRWSHVLADGQRVEKSAAEIQTLLVTDSETGAALTLRRETLIIGLLISLMLWIWWRRRIRNVSKTPDIAGAGGNS